MKTSISKAERLLQEEYIILTHPGLRRTEIAEKLGVHRSTVSRDIDELSILYPLVEDDEGGLSFAEEFSIDSIIFSSYEAVYVYLACKLMADTLDRHSPFAASAVRKLGMAIEKVSPRLSSIMKMDADKLDSLKQISDKGFLSALEELTLGWMNHELVRIRYNSPKHNEIRVYDVGIVRILPNRQGGTFVVLTFHPLDKKLLLFRIDRIRQAILLGEDFTLPDNIDIDSKIDEAWSIWIREEPPVTVRLKFAAGVARRVKETQWHSSQIIKDLPDGSITVQFSVSEPEEMYPWIRGWGKDVEILEPVYLRLRYIAEIKEIAEKFSKY